MTGRTENDKNALIVSEGTPKPSGATRLFGSLRDALLAAGREPPENEQSAARHRPHPIPAATELEYERSEPTVKYVQQRPAVQVSGSEKRPAMSDTKDAPRDPRTPQHSGQNAGKDASKDAAPASGAAGTGTAVVPVAAVARVPVDPAILSAQVPRTQPVARGQGGRPGGDARTQLLRGKQKVSRAKFHQDPVVGWLVIVGGPGLGAHRSIYEGNNTVGRASTQRVPIDFGDDTISSEEQAYIRYDSNDRSFLFVPNLAKTNVVQVNDMKPTGAVALKPMDVITMGRTQLVFVPFCGAEFDWAELSDVRE
jgi:hypothetical protein